MPTFAGDGVAMRCFYWFVFHVKPPYTDSKEKLTISVKPFNKIRNVAKKSNILRFEKSNENRYTITIEGRCGKAFYCGDG
jgi:hypothetical protein